jgi:hypothetical protein
MHALLVELEWIDDHRVGQTRGHICEDGRAHPRGELEVSHRDAVVVEEPVCDGFLGRRDREVHDYSQDAATIVVRSEDGCIFRSGGHSRQRRTNNRRATYIRASLPQLMRASASPPFFAQYRRLMEASEASWEWLHRILVVFSRGKKKQLDVHEQ